MMTLGKKSLWFVKNCVVRKEWMKNMYRKKVVGKKC
jgi:hypothetical protein